VGGEMGGGVDTRHHLMTIDFIFTQVYLESTGSSSGHTDSPPENGIFTTILTIDAVMLEMHKDM